MGVNKWIGIGHLGKNPEYKTTQNSELASFSLAISETYKDKSGEKQTATEWVNCVVWGKLASVAEKYLKKGSKVYVEGKLKTDSYEKDGQKRYSTKVNVFSFEMLDRKSGSNNLADKSNNNQISNDNGITVEESDDLPFS
jgi:single-strand DNA-binding protein